MERSTKHEAKLILTWLISVAMIGLYRVCTLVVRVYISKCNCKLDGRACTERTAMIDPR
jgi:hypothetical protein